MRATSTQARDHGDIGRFIVPPHADRRADKIDLHTKTPSGVRKQCHRRPTRTLLLQRRNAARSFHRSGKERERLGTRKVPHRHVDS
ncbi:hypothetical protein EVAR_60719_1 [Eumeta japonica]|uniref:Uncharacterized protein n=1 Tax=Eumeta variegata TaxID=151549 RepID=A0A4C1ZAS6_EUMVA|nr:hypothetical protein EVAR_60719_1 [Eumeta japonica]